MSKVSAEGQRALVEWAAVGLQCVHRLPEQCFPY